MIRSSRMRVRDFLINQRNTKEENEMGITVYKRSEEKERECELSVDTQFDVIEGGYTEDGDKEFFDCWYVVATHTGGRRFVYRTSFRHYDIRLVHAEVEELAAFIEDRFQEESWDIDKISNNQSWHETFPVYGSSAYQTRGGEEELVEFENKAYEN